LSSNCPLITRKQNHACEGFSLIELLVVIAIIAILTALMIPALTSLKGAGEVTKSAYDLVGTLETARAYAIANNTYVWVGFFEEDGSALTSVPATNGTGRVVLSVVASKDGLQGFDANSSASASNKLDAIRLVQLGKLVKMGNVHLAAFPDGANTGDSFDARPAAGSDYARIGGTNPPTSSKFPFQFPVGNPAPTPQYTFVKTLQFNPRGECRVNSTYDLRQVVEIGLQQAHGNILDTRSSNVIAVQITGVAGNAKIYRR
jgi:prepilin-type N-terminal cleavage/methylation domain-containing protein